MKLTILDEDPTVGASVLTLLFLLLLLLGFAITSWNDEQSFRALEANVYRDQFAPPAHLNSEEARH